MEIINLTPHTINEIESGKSFPPSGEVARVKTHFEKIETLEGIPFYEVGYGEIEGIPIPDLSKDTFYIVSGLVLEAIKDKYHYIGHPFIAPGELVRDEDGKPIGCRGFKVA